MNERAWHFDKRLTLSVLVLLGAQLVASGWWAARVDTRLGEAERRLERTEMQLEAGRATNQEIFRAVASIDSKLSGIGAEMRGLTSRLDRFEQRYRGTP